MEPIAIIGIGCRFPQANNPEAFWHLLREGGDAIIEVPPERWDVDALYDPEPGTSGKMNTRWGGFLENVERFDPEFFGISPREAERMDPQQRLFMEVGWEALENAGIAPDQLSGSQTGVFVSIASISYDRFLFKGVKDLSLVSAYDGTGTTFSLAANRLSYLLNLRGPSMAIETACSSSLVSVHLACQSLRSKESNLCLVGGVNLVLSPELNVIFSQARMMSADGRCKTFDAKADGYVRGEGCGIVVLKRLSDAQRDGDRIQAIIRGTAVNQDGQSNGITAPNGPSQQAVIRQALKNAKVNPAQISYVEAHGTGTALGDPIEVKSLKRVLMKDREPDQPCYLGSVKTNIGHLEAAAGVAGLIKVVLSLQHQEIPPNLHFQQLNPYISLKKTTFSIPTERQSWNCSGSRLAGVSAFGFGGTNCHVIVEEAPKFKVVSNHNERPLHLLTLSAKSELALRALASKYQTYLQSHSESSLADISFTANTGRSHFEYRLAIVSESREQLGEQLDVFVTGGETVGLASGKIRGKKREAVAFLFTGQGSQYVGMGKQLYETEPTFRAAINQCNQILAPHLKTPLIEVLYPNHPESNQTEKSNDHLISLDSDFESLTRGDKLPIAPSKPEALNETAFTQPALFALEYALATLWQSWGVKPTAVMGHSVGEYVAACVAGVFSLEDGLKLIAARARLMQELPQEGEMVAVFAEESKVRTMIEPYHPHVAIAAINGPELTVISGQRDFVLAVITDSEEQGIKTKKLQVSHAFHSPMMEPMLAAFRRIAEEITYSPPQLSLISNVTGKQVATEVATAEYWCSHILQPVRFYASMDNLVEQGYEVFLEIGPKPTLLGMGRYCLLNKLETQNLALLPSLHPEQEDWEQMLQSLTTLYLRGLSVNWSGFDQAYCRHRLSLPTYPWQRQRYWIEGTEFSASDIAKWSRKRVLSQNNLHPLLGQRLHSALKEIQFESQISQESPAFLSDHQICQTVIFPASGYLEMALAAGKTICPADNFSVEEITFQEELILSEAESITLQSILFPESPELFSWQIFSLTSESGTIESVWTLHASGKIRLKTFNPQSAEVDLTALPAQYIEEISGETHYQKFLQRQIKYNSSFQAVEKIWMQEGQALALIRLPETLVKEIANYQLHPVLMDTCFQILGSILPQAGQEDVYLPVGLKSLQVYQSPGSPLWIQAQILPQDSNQRFQTVNLRLFDEHGTTVAQLKELSVRQVNRQTLQQIYQQDLYQLLTAEPSERRSLLVSYLSQLLTKVSGIPAPKLNWQQPLSTLGIDSLMATDLRRRIEVNLGIVVPIEYFAGLSIDQFVTQVLLLLESNTLSQQIPQLNAADSLASSISQANRWVNPLESNSQTRFRLFCFPYAGAGASIFHSWSEALPSEIEVCPIQLPGRENRLGETPLTRLKPLIETLTPLLRPHLDIPFALFGHSMGAILSFELVRELRRRQLPSPVCLFVSGSLAPQIPDLEPPIHRLSDSKFKEKLKQLKGTPDEVLQDTELMELYLPALKADFALLETYFYANESPLNIPISVFGGQQDNKVSPEALAAWREQTNQDFTLKMFPGDHFFLHVEGQNLLQTIAQELQQLLILK